MESLTEAGDQLFTFLAFPPSQWKALRTTNALKRIKEEFPRRTKTQASLPGHDAVLLLLFGLLRSLTGTRFRLGVAPRAARRLQPFVGLSRAPQQILLRMLGRFRGQVDVQVRSVKVMRTGQVHVRDFSDCSVTEPRNLA